MRPRTRATTKAAAAAAAKRKDAAAPALVVAGANGALDAPAVWMGLEAFDGALFAALVKSGRFSVARRYLETGRAPAKSKRDTEFTRMPAVYWWFRNSAVRGARKLFDLMWERGLVTRESVNAMDSNHETGLFSDWYMLEPTMLRRFFERAAHLVDWGICNIYGLNPLETHCRDFGRGLGIFVKDGAIFIDIITEILRHAPDYLFTGELLFYMAGWVKLHPVLDRIWHRFPNLEPTQPKHFLQDFLPIHDLDARPWMISLRARLASALRDALDDRLPSVLLHLIAPLVC